MLAHSPTALWVPNLSLTQASFTCYSPKEL